MTGELVPLTLENLGNGGAMELFQRELKKVLENIRDPNTDAEAVRAVTLKVLIKPQESREQAALKVHVESKLIAPRGFINTIYLGEKDGEVVAVHVDPKQGDMFRVDNSVLPMKARPA